MADATPPSRTRSQEKRRAILQAAQEVFLSQGYLGTNMDLVASRSGVSKQTVYAHFGNKEALFIEIVTSMTDAAGDHVHHDRPDLVDDADLETYLRDYAERQLLTVMQPRLLQLRRLVIGEVARFPDLARVLHERGPRRAITQIAQTFDTLRERGLLAFDDSTAAAEWFNWLVMAAPLNRAMMLGDDAVPGRDELRRHAAEAVRIFLVAFGAAPGRPAIP